MAKWSNWSGRQTAEPKRIDRPTTEREFVAAIGAAREHRWPIRAVGASHSHSRVAAVDGLLVETDGWQGLIGTDPASSGSGSTGSGSPDGPTASVRAGTRIHQLGEPLYRRGLALVNQGDIDKQSIAGAIATGTHGTGPTLANLSTAVVGLRVALADGDVVWCDSAQEPDLFAVARHSLGAVGLITEVELRVRSRYRLHERQWFASPDEVLPEIDHLVDATRHFEFFWVPDRDLCACKSLDELPARGNGDDEPSGPSPEVEVLSDRERRGWSHRIISSIRDDKHTEMEYAVPAEAGPQCFAELRQMILTEFPDLVWPLEYRTLAEDDLLISAAAGRPTVTISAHQDVGLDDRPLFEACEEIFRSHDGRPHWGKVHYRTGQELAELHPSYRTWWELRDRFDPDGLFVTEDLARLRP